MARAAQVARRAVTLAVFGGALAGGGLLIAHKAVRPTVGQRFHTFALFRDGSRLPLGSQVVIAGVRVGEIDALGIDGRLARIGLRLRDDVVLYDDAFAMKKSSSLLGDNYIELSPGTPTTDGGAPRPRLASGQPIPQVVEGASTDRVLRAVDAAVPRAERGLARAGAAVRDARAWTAGPFDSALANTETWLDSDRVSASLATAARGAAGFEAATERVARLTAGLDQRVNRTLTGLERDTARARSGMSALRADLARGLGEARASLDQVDAWLADAPTLLAAYTGRTPPERQGELARLVTSDEVATTLTDATDAAVETVRGFDRLRSFLGFRIEYNLASEARFYVIADLATQGDSFLRAELSKGQDGALPVVTLTDAPGTTAVDQHVEVQEGFRVSAQWGRRLGPAALRIGLKDSSFGVGADLQLGRHLELRTDVFDATFGRAPRLKVSAALEVFRSIYVLAGIDDALNAPREVPIAPWPAAQDVPLFFRAVHTGRDYFGGVMLRFDDADLAQLMRVYGGILTGLL